MSLTTAPASSAGQALPRTCAGAERRYLATDAPYPSTATPRRASRPWPRALMRRTEKGKHYGQITAKAFAVLQAHQVWGPLSHRPLPDLRRDIGIFICRG
jgi:hypothetical protein